MTSFLFGTVRICRSLFKRNYLKKEKLFLSSLFHFSNLQQILKILKKEKLVIANELPILHSQRLGNKHHFGTSFDSQHVKVSETLVEPAREHFYDIFSSSWGKMIWKMSPWVKFEILVMFVNTLTAEDKYPVRDWENLQFPR